MSTAPPTPGPVRVVAVEADRARRSALVRLLEEGGSVRVAGEAATASEARGVVARVRPAVVVLGLEMAPGPDGRSGALAAVEAVLADATVAILVLSSPSEPTGGTLAVQALAAGAVDVLPHPISSDDDGAAGRLRRRVGVLARLQMVTRRAPAAPRGPAGEAPGCDAPVIAIASSTGGPGALRELLLGLGHVPAPVLLVQHIHSDFTASFASWLQGETGLLVGLARAGRAPEGGRVHVAPGDVHLRLASRPLRMTLDEEPALLARPSGDELLTSVAAVAGPAAIGVVLTGMGDDGARGLLAIRAAGGATFAQDAASSVVDGMPRAARELGAVGRSLPPRALGHAVAELVRVQTERLA